MGEGGFEPPKALPADLQSVPFGHSGIHPNASEALSSDKIVLYVILRENASIFLKKLFLKNLVIEYIEKIPSKFP